MPRASARLAASLTLAGLLTAACDPGQPPPEVDAGPVTEVPPAGDGGTSGSLAGAQAFAVTSGSQIHLGGASGAQGYGFVLSNSGLSCAGLQALDGGHPAVGYTYVLGEVLRAQGGLAAPTPGTYRIGGASSVTELVGALSVADHRADGTFSAARAAQSGTITLTSASDTELSGSFQAIVPDANGAQSALTGTFDVSFCP